MKLQLSQVFLSAAACSALIACGGGDEAPTSQTGTSGEIINGISVPPAPDFVSNAATVGGIDSDRNGIRDDIDRQIANDFGTEPVLYAKTIVYFRTGQTAILNPDPIAVEAHLAALGCIGDRAALARVSSLTDVMVNTAARGRAYVRAFAGVTLTERVCS